MNAYKVLKWVDDSELEKVLNEWADAYDIIDMFRNGASDGGRESTTIVMCRKATSADGFTGTSPR